VSDFIVYCTFDLKGATRQDYENAYADLGKLGLRRVVTSDAGGQVVVPTTSVIGQFTGTNPATVSAAVRESVRRAFTARRLASEIFVLAGGNWAWAAGTT
jgi:hypothetical protein